MEEAAVVPIERIGRLIYLIRGRRVMLDSDLARIYGVSTARLNQQVKRNRRRFPEDFIFPLTKREFDNLMLQSATSSFGYGGRRKPPYAFTEHGAIMLASVLNSQVAVEASVAVVRAFVQLREMFRTDKRQARRLARLEGRLAKHDGEIQRLFVLIQGLMDEPGTVTRRIGFEVRREE